MACGKEGVHHHNRKDSSCTPPTQRSALCIRWPHVESCPCCFSQLRKVRPDHRLPGGGGPRKLGLGGTRCPWNPSGLSLTHRRWIPNLPAASSFQSCLPASPAAHSPGPREAVGRLGVWVPQHRLGVGDLGWSPGPCALSRCHLSLEAFPVG